MKSVLTDKQLDELRRRLEAERARILGVLQQSQAAAPQPDQETEMEEAAQRVAERTQELEIEQPERALLGDVERALAKFHEGTYGLSETTGEPIRYERLAAVPWARDDVGE